MSILSFVKSQFIEVIEWLDATSDTIVYRFPVKDQEIKMGAQLIVRESQVAVFVNQGQIADVFGPGHYTLQTQNMPVLTKILSWKTGFTSPFKAEVYFVNTKLFTDRKWGTAQPITLRDAEFGAVRLRAFGNYSFRVKDAAKFLKDVSGTDGHFETDEIEGQIKRVLLSGFTDTLAELKVPMLDLATHFDEVGKAIKTKLGPEVLETYGLELQKFLIESVTLPPELEKALDQRIKMNMMGDPSKYMQFQLAESVPAAAANGNSMAGMGMGMASGMQMAQAMNQMLQGGAAQPAPAGQAAAPSDGGLESKLRKLKDAFEAGLLDEAEYKAKKAKLLDAF
jgi:membrane protease subunit (stomatin/prohibitin family)